MEFTYDSALALLREYNAEPFHLRHAMTVAAVMGRFADALGYGGERDFWTVVGLLHDVDFERYPDEHCAKCREILRAHGASERLVHAVACHGYGLCSELQPEHEMEKVLYAVDELTGLIGAAARMRPSGSIQDMELKSLEEVQDAVLRGGLLARGDRRRRFDAGLGSGPAALGHAGAHEARRGRHQRGDGRARGLIFPHSKAHPLRPRHTSAGAGGCACLFSVPVQRHARAHGHAHAQAHALALQEAVRLGLGHAARHERALGLADQSPLVRCSGCGPALPAHDCAHGAGQLRARGGQRQLVQRRLLA